jgi:hypothetical protein
MLVHFVMALADSLAAAIEERRSGREDGVAAEGSATSA